ncbi:MAG: Fic family protein [Balneolales bacterium]
MDESNELEQLRELIGQFPDKYPLTKVKEANRLARTRFDTLDNEIIFIITQRVRSNEIQMGIDTCFKLCEIFHSYIFKDIISINGKFRSVTHDGSGSVYFGGQRHQELKSRFSGVNPQLIRGDLSEAFQYLANIHSQTPIDDAFRFYQKFVRTHPFYDGNGRVARLFVNLYLHIYSKFVDWKNLQNQAKFLKKLNRFHLTQLDNDFRWWINTCSKYVYEISEEDEKT